MTRREDDHVQHQVQGRLFDGSDEAWDRARRFHGHLGPWLTVGLKLGDRLLRQLDIPPHFGLEVEVECPAAPPPSCLLDGLQSSTGATYGKANLRRVDGPDVRATMLDKQTGRRLCGRLNDGVAEQLGDWLLELGDEAASQRVWAAADDELFTITEVTADERTD